MDESGGLRFGVCFDDGFQENLGNLLLEVFGEGVLGDLGHTKTNVFYDVCCTQTCYVLITLVFAWYTFMI